MPEPIKWKSKIILVKPEATYGVDSTPTGAANAMLLTDVAFQPMEGEDVSRNLELPWMGAQEEIPTGLRAVLSGSFELVGSGTAGTPPAWGPLMRSAGCAEVITAGVKVEYTPISDNHESCVSYFQIGGTRSVILGGRSNIQLGFNAQGIPIGRLTLTGLFSIPTEVARPTPVLTGWKTPQVASKVNTAVYTIDGTSFVGNDFNLDLGNEVVPRLLFGTERIVIVDKSESASMRVEAVPVSTYDPFTKANTAGARVALAIEHGTVAGRKVRVDVPTAQQKRLSGYEEGQKILEWPLSFVPLPNAGNDQWKITLT